MAWTWHEILASQLSFNPSTYYLKSLLPISLTDCYYKFIGSLGTGGDFFFNSLQKIIWSYLMFCVFFFSLTFQGNQCLWLNNAELAFPLILFHFQIETKWWLALSQDVSWLTSQLPNYCKCILQTNFMKLTDFLRK